LIITDERILRQPSKEFDGTFKELDEIVEKMKEAMKENNGIGIAAIQIGLPYRIFLAGDPVELFINPKIKQRSPYEKTDYEACLSCENTHVRIKRPSYIVMEYFTVENNKTIKKTRKFKDFDARVVLHEFDHLNGFLITDRGKVYRP